MELAMKKVIAELSVRLPWFSSDAGLWWSAEWPLVRSAITELAIALAFGLSIVAMAYVIGQISGCHVNPAVSRSFCRRTNDT